MSKKSNIYTLLLWTYLAGSFCGCITYYKTVAVPVNQIALNEYLSKKQIWTIEDENHYIRRIGNVRIRKDSISGLLSDLGLPDHPANKETYRGQKGALSIHYLHLLTHRSEFPDVVKIPLSDITSATTHENATGKTALVNTLIYGAGAAVITGGIVLAISAICNCPYVKVVGIDTTMFQGSLFPGAISKSLERSDNLLMKTVPLDSVGKINIKISNELPEIEYFNHIELLEVRDMPYGLLGQHAMGHPVSFQLQDHLLSATTIHNRNIKEEIQSIRGGIYDFNEQGNDYEFNKIFLTFDRTNLENDAMLIVRAKQSKWMETVASFTLRQFGTAYDSWVERLDQVDSRKYNQSAVDRGISLNAYIKRNNIWEYIGSYTNPGTLAYRELALNLDARRTNEERIEIKLEAAHGFWDVDYVGITDGWSNEVSLSKLTTISAVNQTGANVMQAIAAEDKNYTELPAEGDFIDMHFETPANQNGYLILSGTGYYHHERKYSSKPNYAFLKTVKRDKMTSHQLSRLLQSQLDMEAKKASHP